MTLVFEELHGLIKQEEQSPGSNRIFFDDRLRNALQDIESALGKIKEELGELGGSPDMNFSERKEWWKKEPTIKSHFDCLNWHKSTMIMLLTTVTWYVLT